MNIRKLIAGAAAVVSAAAIAVSASAYYLNTDLSIFWSASTTVPSVEFVGITGDSQITVTYKGDASLADTAGHEYWCIKPMINDSGWPLIAGIEELTPTADGSAYDVDPAGTSITFTIPDELVEHVQIAGIAFMGHGITLETITISDAPAEQAPADTAAPEKLNPDTGVEGVAGFAALGVTAAAAMLISRKRK